LKKIHFGNPPPEIPPNPPLVKGGRGDFWGALPHGNLFGCGFAALCPEERRSKGRDIARWKIDSLVEDEVISRDRGINH